MSRVKAFLTLKDLSLEIHELQSICALLHWDQETYMPKGAITPRSHQIALLSEMIHDKKTSRKFKMNLEKLVSLSSDKIKVKGLSREEKIIVREWLKDFRRLDKLPKEFVKTYSQVTAEACQIWASAKKENNFKVFAPFLEKIVSLAREKAQMLGFEEHPYDALLQNYEPCMNTKKLEAIFTPLQKELTSLLQKIQKARKVDSRFLHRTISDEKQKDLGFSLLKCLPLEPEYSRMDLSSHPFSIALHPHDSRITTRILPKNFMSNLYSILHEAGHSMYEMGLRVDQWGTPLAEPVSLSVHESQSRFWETLIGRSRPFWRFFYPVLQKKLPSLKKIPFERFYKASNHVAPSLIRVESDEVTYCLHVLVRFEIEKELISGKLSVHDLPMAWREKMKLYLGIEPTTDQEGCLQDIHWSLGDFGYFPTYALGNLMAAQLFTVFEKKNPSWQEKLEEGEMGFIREWLKENIHRWGRTYNLEELVKKISGKPFQEKDYCRYLKKKYTKIYNL